jgi:hypothetical protein
MKSTTISDDMDKVGPTNKPEYSLINIISKASSALDGLICGSYALIMQG